MNKSNTVQDILARNPFLEFLASIDQGRAVGQAAESYPRLVEAVHDTGKKGRFTLEITVAPEGAGEVRTVVVTCKCSVKVPEKDTRQTVFFVTDDMQLSRTDPNQLEFEMPVMAPRAAQAGVAAVAQMAPAAGARVL